MTGEAPAPEPPTDPIHRDHSIESLENHSDSSGDDGHSTHVAHHREYSSRGKGLVSSAQVHSDGRINLSLECRKEFPDLPDNHSQEVNEFAIDADWTNCPPMNIVIMIVGSRGDVQPYVALGQRLKQDGHRVRIATHETFRKFVTDEGLEFYSIGGNPHDLMSYMVKNPGLMPSMASLTNGDIRKKRSMLKEMIYGCWESCHAPDQGEASVPFIADAIISNPPGFAHIHCAEALGIPLQMSFTMPWSPTTAFPQPLVNITSSNAKPGLTNYLTYEIAGLLTWQGTGDIINKFRKRALKLDPLDNRSGPGILDIMKVPWTYCMSPALVPKPQDWKNYIDVVGFYFLDLATHYEPPADLAAFLDAGETPIYIGFGSVVVDDPQAMTSLIFEATEQAGVRALVSAGWGGLGGTEVPPHIFILDNIPHDWLFDQERVAAVVHHGGAGTTAIGLAKGRPTVVVPFFGDQGFWGSMIYKAGAGPKPIPHKKLDVPKLRDAIMYVVSPAAKEAAKHLAEQIRDENGVKSGVESFYQHLPLLNMRCDLDPSCLAVWWSTRYCLKLSALAAQTLAHAGLLDLGELDLHRTKEHELQRGDSFAGDIKSVFWSMTDLYSGIADNVFCPVKGILETSTAVPRGIMKMVSAVVGGSSPTNSKGPPKPGEKKRSIMVEAREGFLDGYSESIMHLIHRDRNTTKKETLKEVKGIFEGKARKLYRPGVHPVECTFESVEQQRRKARIEEGLKIFKESTGTRRAHIIKLFHDSKDRLEERRAEYVDAAQKALLRQKRNKMEPLSPVASSSDTATLVATPEPSKVDVAIQGEIDWDAAFEKDLALAMKISLEEGLEAVQTSSSQ